MAYDLSRRTALKGMLNGAGVVVGVPLLNAFLDGNGEAMAATGAAVPVRFGTWFWGLGVNPNRWFPTKPGMGYDLPPELAPIAPLQHKISVFGKFNVPLDGAPNLPHASGGPAIRTGRALTAAGAPWAHRMLKGVWPQVQPAFWGIALFRWDINVRESAVLGLVGAGGLGMALDTAINLFQWDRVALILATIFAVVIVAEFVVTEIRKRII